MQWKQLSILGACLLMSCSSLDAGWRAQKAGNYDEAQKQAMIALSREPRNPEVYQLVATTAMSRGQYDTALKAAQFARKLDGGTPKTERLIRQISYGKKDWKSLCEAGLRLSNQPEGAEAADEARFAEGIKALKKSTSGDGYGCVAALAAMGVAVDGAEQVKQNYAMQQVRNGQYREALAVAETGEGAELKQLVASRSLFALNRKDEAAERLRQYVNGADSMSREMRMTQAAAVCETYRQYPIEAELLSGATSADNELRRIVALRRSYRQEEADSLLASRLANRNLPESQVLADMKTLCEAGYGDMAVRVYEGCASCGSGADTVFKAADMLMDARQPQAAIAKLAELGDANVSDGALQARLFDWYRARKYHAQALLCAERAHQAGIKDDAFDAARLETYVKAREYKVYERESKSWIASHAAPAAESRLVVAKIESGRSNWRGVVDVLKPVDDAHVLGGEALTLYLNGLSATRDYERLYATLTKYRADMKPAAKADFFWDSDAEPQFNKSIDPLLKGSEIFEGEMLLARYLYEVKQDEAAGDKAISDALAAGGYSSNSYERAVGFYRVHGQPDKTMAHAQAWAERYPSNAGVWDLIGLLYLSRKEYEDAGAAFEKYLQLRNSPAEIKPVFNKYSNVGEVDEGLRWVDRMSSLYLNTASERDYIRARAEVYYSLFQMERNAELQHRYRNLAVADYRRVIDGPGDSKALLSDAVALTMMGADDEACRAFENAQKGQANGALSESQRAYYVQVMSRSGKSDDEIRKVASTAKSASELFALTELVESHQRSGVLDPLIEDYLNDKSVDTRIKAYHFLIRHASSNGDIRLIERYNKKLESSAPDNPDIRMEIVRTTISMNLVDESVRHLRWLQMMRPDSHDILNLELTLGRRHPDRSDVQALLATTLDAAEGIYYRLDWISQFFERYGDYERALYYAEKAYTASTLKDTAFELRLLKLYLRTGKYEESEIAPQLLDNIRASVDWKPQLVVELAEVAQVSGYYRLAQVLMNEAIGLSPDLPGLKVKKLEMALDSNNEGQIALSLEKASETPMADVSEPLIERGQMLDIISAIDLYEQNGDHGLALSTLMQVLPAYLQMRGIVSTRRTLESLSEYASVNRSESVGILASGELLGDSPCKALAYASEIENPEIWARVAVRCPDARDSIMQSIRHQRNSMNSRRRTDFDARLYTSLVQMQRADLAGDYADEMGMSDSALMEFKRHLIAGSALDALTGLADDAVNPDDHIEVIRMLSAYGYTSEMIDYARQNLEKMPAGDRADAAAIAVLLGAKDSVFIQALPGDADISQTNLNDETAARLYAVSMLKSWMSRTESRKIAAVFYIALACAKRNPAQRQQIQKDIIAEIDKRQQRTTLLLSASEYALSLGLNEFAQSMLMRLKGMMPSSDYVYRSLSVADARLGKIDQAWADLEDGARCTVDLGEYWMRAASLHSESSIVLRKRINDARLSIMPRQPSLYVTDTAYALESGDSHRASESAKLAYQYGGDGILTDIVDAYEASNASAAMPEDFYAGTSARALKIQARMAMNRGDADMAMQHYIDAAQRASWPLDVYAEAIESTMASKKWAQAEQLIAKMAADYPLAYMPYIYRSVYELAQSRPSEAWQSYLDARQRVFSTQPWVQKIVYAGVQYAQYDFVEKLYREEEKIGAYDTASWVETLLDCILEKVSKNTASAKGEAQTGIQFIEHLIPAAAGVARENDEIRNKFIRLSETADRIDWLQRLGTTSY